MSIILSHISLPNYFGAGQDYEDIRFLSNNALDSTIAEDNMPPSPVTSVNHIFHTRLANRFGTTTITWTDLRRRR